MVHGKVHSVTGKLDRVLVIDVEATCWENGKPPDGQRPEIIEIGVCMLDVRTGERVGRQSILVKPEQSHVSAFCTDLTSLTPAQVAGGVSFERACRMLQRKYRARRRVWASYGDFDRRQFERQCHERGITYPFGSTHINVKSLLAIMRGLRHEVGMKHAMELFDLPMEGRHHRAVDDAWNTALLLSHLILDRRAVLDTVPPAAR